MAKKLIKKIKLQIPAGKANPAPPIGPALGGAGVNIMERRKIKPVTFYLLKFPFFTIKHLRLSQNNLLFQERFLKKQG